MINELHQLAVALGEAGVVTDSWYREYKPIPKITDKAPCIRIVLSEGKVERLESVQKDLGSVIRKYGNNFGTFPAMNLAALYRVTDKDVLKKISDLIENEGQGVDIDAVKKWCTENNWGSKLSSKYRNSMVETPQKMLQLMGEFSYYPLNRLIDLARTFPTPEKFHQELDRKAFELLKRKKDIVLALQILFDFGKESNLSVIIDNAELEDSGLQSVGVRFTRELNQILLQAEDKLSRNTDSLGTWEKDAFGNPFIPMEQPMPQVKLAGGFSVSLRTMFKEQLSQYRYRRIGNATYPISSKIRQQLADSLTWLSLEEQKDNTWINIDRNEILFVYPSKLPKVSQKFTRFFKRGETTEHQQARFETEAAGFREYISKTKCVDPEHYPDYIQIFVLRKLDKARSKVVYTRHATPSEIIQHSEDWQDASDNLPNLMIGQPKTLFPLRIPEIMNCVWRQDGVVPVDAYKPVANYHGIELLFGVSREIIATDLHRLVSFSPKLALYEGRRFHDLKATGRKQSSNKKIDETFWKFRDTVMLMGMLLYWLNFRRSDYVKEYPYLLGQLLKVSDSLHELYCYAERNKEKDKEYPPQFVGSSMYVAISEMPNKALSQLGTRMRPYLAWAKTHKDKCIVRKRKKENGEIEEWKEPKAGYYLSVFEKTADQISSVLTNRTRFNDSEKALLFIGYLASFPKMEHRINASTVENEENIGG